MAQRQTLKWLKIKSFPLKQRVSLLLWYSGTFKFRCVAVSAHLPSTPLDHQVAVHRSPLGVRSEWLRGEGGEGGVGVGDQVSAPRSAPAQPSSYFLLPFLQTPSFPPLRPLPRFSSALMTILSSAGTLQRLEKSRHHLFSWQRFGFFVFLGHMLVSFLVLDSKLRSGRRSSSSLHWNCSQSALLL